MRSSAISRTTRAKTRGGSKRSNYESTDQFLIGTGKESLLGYAERKYYLQAENPFSTLSQIPEGQRTQTSTRVGDHQRCVKRPQVDSTTYVRKQAQKRAANLFPANAFWPVSSL